MSDRVQRIGIDGLVREVTLDGGPAGFEFRVWLADGSSHLIRTDALDLDGHVLLLTGEGDFDADTAQQLADLVQDAGGVATLFLRPNWQASTETLDSLEETIKQIRLERDTPTD